MKDEKEIYDYDPAVNLLDLNQNTKFKTEHWIKKEYKICEKVVKKAGLLRISEFR